MEREDKKACQKIGIRKEQLRRERKAGNQKMIRILMKKMEREKGKKEKQNKINESRYNNIDKNEGIAKIFGRKEERKKQKFNSQIQMWE